MQQHWGRFMKKYTDAARGKAAGGQIQLWYLFRCNGGTQRPNFTTRQVCIFFIWSKSERSEGFCVNPKSFISRETLTIYSEEMVPLLFLQVVCGPSCCTAKGFSLEFQLFPRPQPCRLVLSSAFFLLGHSKDSIARWQCFTQRQYDAIFDMQSSRFFYDQ